MLDRKKKKKLALCTITIIRAMVAITNSKF